MRQVYLITGHVGQEELHQVSLDVLQGPGRFQRGQPAQLRALHTLPPLLIAHTQVPSDSIAVPFCTVSAIYIFDEGSHMTQGDRAVTEWL